MPRRRPRGEGCGPDFRPLLGQSIRATVTTTEVCCEKACTIGCSGGRKCGVLPRTDASGASASECRVALSVFGISIGDAQRQHPCRCVSHPGAIIESRDVEIGAMCLTAPDDWVRREPGSQFLLTEFALPKVAGAAEDGRLTVSSAGGSVEDNLTRWKGQFGGKPEKESQETIDVAGVKITVVDYTGTFSDQRGPFAPVTPKAGYRMLAAIIPLDNQLFFVKGYGPEQTLAAHADKIRGFFQSLKPQQAAIRPARYGGRGAARGTGSARRSRRPPPETTPSSGGTP